MTLSKNHANRVKRAAAKLDKAVDLVAQASGEMWPAELRGYKKDLDDTASRLEQMLEAMRRSSRNADAAEVFSNHTAEEDAEHDARQLDIEESIAEAGEGDDADSVTKEPTEPVQPRRRRS